MLTLLRFSDKLKERTIRGTFTGAFFCAYAIFKMAAIVFQVDSIRVPDQPASTRFRPSRFTPCFCFDKIHCLFEQSFHSLHEVFSF
jgi:hypothetical protein